MEISWAELVQATPDDFSPIVWPCGAGSVEQRSQGLLRAADALANSINGPLVGLTVALGSSRPEHVLLARLLACHGAAVSFFCPEPVTWDREWEPLLRALRSALDQDYDHLDPAPLQDVTAANFTEGPRFSVARKWPGQGEHSLAGRCARVFAYDLLGKTPGEVGPQLARFAMLLTGGGFLELFGDERDPAGQAVLEHVVGHSFSFGFGAQAACSSPRGKWRVSMRWLGDAVREYPSEEDNAQVMAHCEARLHFAAHFVGGADVLEAGCGSGVGARLFLAAGADRVVGLDYNAEALALARGRGADPRAEFRHWDLNQTPLPLPDECFDVVVCLEVLEHVREQRALLAELRRVLKPGGRLLVSVPDRGFEEAFAVFNGYRNTYHVRVPERGELEQMLADFTQVRYARQIDFLASCVVEDGATGLGGAWREQPPGPGKDAVETILAVGIKPPASLARNVPAYRPHLRVFDNAIHRQIEEKHHVRRLEVALAAEKAGRWQDRNQHEAVLRRLVSLGPQTDPGWQKDMVRTWFGGNAEAYACCEVLPGDWIPRMEEILASGGNRCGGGFRSPAHWELVQGNGEAVLRVGVPNPAGVKTVLYPRPEAEVGIRSLWGWHRRGARAVWFAEDGGWKQYDLFGYLAWRVTRWVARRLFPCARRRPLPPGPRPGSRLIHWAMALGRRSAPTLVCHPPSAGSGPAAWQEWVAAGDDRPAAPGPAEGLKTIHYIGALHAGGAERQLCNLAIAQKRRGLSVRVVTTAELVGSYGHYAELLAPQKVPVRKAARVPLSPRLLETVPWHLLRAVPASIQPHVVELVHELLADQPAVLHCWLDQPNVIGAIAGLMAGLPRIILSTRNSNPTNFPRLWEEFLQGWYQLASRSSRVHLIANSHSGAASYAEWLGLPQDRFHVVLNGVCFDHFPEPTEALRREARQSFGLSAEDPVVCGVFRLAVEKQPELFLDVVRRVRAHVPQLRVLLAGTGDLEPRVRQLLRENDMGGWVQLLGRRADVATVFLAADASLLTSALEGCPNAVLESQYLGVPIVATAGGGTGDAVCHGITGFLAGVTDAGGLAAALTRLLLDDELRRRMRDAGPGFVRDCFGLGRMVEDTMAVYEAAAGAPGGTARPVMPCVAGRVSRAA